jgi:hypothetical protein
MANFMVDIRGRVNNTPLPNSKYLWALFESVINSIQSIEESSTPDSYIEIYAQRQNYEQMKWDAMESQANSEMFKPEIAAFDSFTVTDNGCGFTTDNYQSFRTADSMLKVSKGCKGIGRFLWLKSFESAKIESNFQENGEWQKREFIFSADGVTPDDNLLPSDRKECKTTVTLDGFKNPYRDKCPKTLEVIARKIIEHCLIYFLLGKCPRIILRDSLGEQIILNQLYESSVQDSLHQDHFELEGNEFFIYHVKMPEGASTHELHLCANDREVRSLDLKNFFPNLQHKIADDTDTGFFYCGYLTGAYLDAKVNSSRTEFDFADEQQQELDNTVPERELVDTAKDYVSAYLQEYIDEINRRKEKRINDFVARQQPQYRFLLNVRPNAIDEIKPELTDSALEIELHKQVLKWDLEAKERGEDIKRNMADNGVPDDEFMPRFEAYCKEVTAISKVSLSQYIIRRKVILDLLEKALEIKEDGSYANENQIHSIICPMHYTSDEVGFEEMNLWIIDERLAYHNFLASDKQMKSMPILESDSESRIDIAVFDEAISFSDKDNQFNSITIIEFKKPNRNDLKPDDKNPIQQVLRYVDDIKNGKKCRANGRPFGNVTSTAFYCYVIADMTPSLKEDARFAGLKITPDGEGYFGYIPDPGVYLEVISLDKLLRDAKERNQILFDKLFKSSPRDVISLSPENNALQE